MSIMAAIESAAASGDVGMHARIGGGDGGMHSRIGADGVDGASAAGGLMRAHGATHVLLRGGAAVGVLAAPGVGTALGPFGVVYASPAYVVLALRAPGLHD